MEIVTYGYFLAWYGSNKGSFSHTVYYESRYQHDGLRFSPWGVIVTRVEWVCAV
jgi:hypothetical protein